MIQLILLLALVGFIIYLIITYIPMPPIFRTAILVVVSICIILYLLQILGIGDVPIPHFRR